MFTIVREQLIPSRNNHGNKLERFLAHFLRSRICFVLFCLMVLVFYPCNCNTGTNTKPVELVVQTEYGKVQGVLLETHREFRGIPFAKPPIGALRFQPPVKPNKWTETEPLIANEFPEYCIQFNVFWNTTEGQEDCLYLNVFSPLLGNSDDAGKRLLPVMVYIHPGGFMFGRGSQFRGDYLMEMGNVVLVTFHYRLGSLGFLNVGTGDSRGNMGMKDQVLALKFVRDNIKNFGGNPKAVTIFGTSAGAASTHYHLISPMSKGLFHRAISSSGTALCPWAFQPNPLKNAKKLANFLKCPENNPAEAVKCLKEKDAKEIASVTQKFLDWYTDPIAAFGPSVEIIGPGENEHTFLLKPPIDIIKSGHVNPAPWIVGFNSHEGYDHSHGIIHNPKLLKELNENWLRLYPSTLEFVSKPDSIKDEIANWIHAFYFNSEPLSDKKLMNLTDAYSDAAFIHCSVQGALMHAQLDNSNPVYLYNFKYKGSHSIVNRRGVSSEGFEVNHVDDLQYVLTSFVYPLIDENHKDKPFQRNYLRMLTNFADTGKLISVSDGNATPETWKSLGPNDGIYWYTIDSHAKMEKCSSDFAKRMKLWDKIRDHKEPEKLPEKTEL